MINLGTSCRILFQHIHTPSKPRTPFQNPEALYTSKSCDKYHLAIWVQWEGTTTTKATWKTYAKRLKAYPDAHLEDKVKSLAAGIVTQAMRKTQLNTYKMRNKKNKETKRIAVLNSFCYE